MKDKQQYESGKGHPARRGGLLCLNRNDYDAVIFDLDGTLVDSMGMWAEIDVDFLALFGIPCPATLQKELEGLTWPETEQYFIDHFDIPLTVSEIGSKLLQMAEERYRDRTPAKDGAVRFVKNLSAHGIKTGLASSNHPGLITHALDAHGLVPFFPVITTCGEVAAGKPSPDVFLKTAEKLGASPGRCLVFEDIPKGILAGKRAGMTVIAVDDAYSKAMEEEKRQLADAYIRSYDEIIWED